jgi:hypothetical protein
MVGFLIMRVRKNEHERIRTYCRERFTRVGGLHDQKISLNTACYRYATIFLAQKNPGHLYNTCTLPLALKLEQSEEMY